MRADDIAATGSPALASIELLEHVASAYNRKDWRALRALYHDEARLYTSAAGDRVVGPDELMDVFEELEDSAYAVGTTTTRALDAAAGSTDKQPFGRHAPTWHDPVRWQWAARAEWRSSASR